MKEAKQIQITEGICKQAGLMRKGGASQAEIAKLLGLSPCTISRIEAARFNREIYEENQRRRREKEKRKAEEPLTISAEDIKKTLEEQDNQIVSQLKMEIPEKPEGIKPVITITDEATAEYPDQVKMMRFQAHQADRIVKTIEENAVMLNTKLDKLNDTLCMILRAVRKE